MAEMVVSRDFMRTLACLTDEDVARLRNEARRTYPARGSVAEPPPPAPGSDAFDPHLVGE